MRPRLTTGLPFSLAHTRMRVQAPFLPTADEFPMNSGEVCVFFAQLYCEQGAAPSSAKDAHRYWTRTMRTFLTLEEFFVLPWGCLRVANFVELCACELRGTLLRRSSHSGDSRKFPCRLALFICFALVP